MKMQYSLGDIELLSNPQFDGPKMLTKYSDNCKPGQHWSCYLPKKNDLGALLHGLLRPTCTEAELKAKTAVAESTSVYCPYIRFKQKNADKLEEAWLFDGEMHNGAHYPLTVFTNNAGRRSSERWKERAENKKEKAKQRGAAAGSQKQWWPNRSRGSPNEWQSGGRWGYHSSWNDGWWGDHTWNNNRSAPERDQKSGNDLEWEDYNPWAGMMKM